MSKEIELVSMSKEKPPASNTSSSPAKSSTAAEKGSTGAAATGANQEPVILINGKDRYTLTYPVGVANGITVYEANYLPEDYAIFAAGTLNDTIFAVQMVHEANQEEQHDQLVAELLKNKYCNHENILKIKQNFTYNGNLCVVMPHNEVTSLRNIMVSTPNFNKGLPENCITVALRETLFGLIRVFETNQVHKKISAGNIFFHEKTSIKLAYGASIYDRNNDLANETASSSSLDINYIFRWGAAPEVYETDPDPASYTDKSDIWLIGILALELAYGSLKVNSRKELDYLAERIRVDRRLPNKGKELKFDGGKMKGKKMVNFIREKMQMPEFVFPKKTKKERVFLLKEYGEETEEKKKVRRGVDLDETKKEGKSFSISFGKMVAECLARDPEKRPDVWMLMEHNFFKDSRSVKYFENVVMKQSIAPVW